MVGDGWEWLGGMAIATSLRRSLGGHLLVLMARWHNATPGGGLPNWEWLYLRVFPDSLRIKVLR
ncbi:MAG: hypothetical protein F6K30_04775 [Cyanothece sp. SIO2G6]|nr:hypothetical protein [Cyanothece sp. SIO2G6]